MCRIDDGEKWFKTMLPFTRTKKRPCNMCKPFIAFDEQNIVNGTDVHNIFALKTFEQNWHIVCSHRWPNSIAICHSSVWIVCHTIIEMKLKTIACHHLHSQKMQSNISFESLWNFWLRALVAYIRIIFSSFEHLLLNSIGVRHTFSFSSSFFFLNITLRNFPLIHWDYIGLFSGLNVCFSTWRTHLNQWIKWHTFIRKSLVSSEYSWKGSVDSFYKISLTVPKESGTKENV